MWGRLLHHEKTIGMQCNGPGDGARDSRRRVGAGFQSHQRERSAAAQEGRAAATARHVQGAADVVGRSRDRRRVQQQRRDRHSVRAPRSSSRTARSRASRPTSSPRSDGAADAKRSSATRTLSEFAGRHEPHALVRELLCREQPPWLVSDPPTARCRRRPRRLSERAAARAAARAGRGPADSYTDRSLYDRCITRGVPGSMMPAIYGNSYHIAQSPGAMSITYEMIHDTRVIPLDGRPHVELDDPPVLGRRARPLGRRHARRRDDELHRLVPYRGSSENLKLIERFTPLGPDTLEWSVTFEDPHTWDTAVDVRDESHARRIAAARSSTRATKATTGSPTFCRLHAPKRPRRTRSNAASLAAT